MRSRLRSSVRSRLVAATLLCGAALAGVAPSQDVPQDPPAPAGDASGVGAESTEQANGADAAPTPPERVLAAHAALTTFVADFESGATERALAFAERLEAELARTDGDEAVRASRRAWRAEERALLAYGAGLAGAELAAETLALETPDEAAAVAREDAALARFVAAAGAAGPGELRDRALAAPGALLAARGERQVLAAQSQAMLTRSEIPFGSKTPEREALLAARATLEEARAALVTRLVHDWRDADVRANLEWVARRLAEIERILERADREEQEREDEQQDQQQDGQQDQQDQQDGEQGGEQDGEPKDGDDGEPQQGEQDPSQESDEGESEPDQPQEGESGEAPQDEQPASPQDTEAGERETNAPTGEEAAPEGSSPREAPQVPATFGDVEVQRLLNRLAEIEQAGEETRRRLRATQRRRVEKDW